MMRRFADCLTRFAVSAAAGFAIVAVCADIVLGQVDNPQPGVMYRGIHAAFLAVVFAAVILPASSWLLLRLVGVRPAWLVMVMGSGATLFLILCVRASMSGGYGTVWLFGLCAACGFGFAALPSRLVWQPTRTG